jgi:hypothetical protein
MHSAQSIATGRDHPPRVRAQLSLLRCGWPDQRARQGAPWAKGMPNRSAMRRTKRNRQGRKRPVTFTANIRHQFLERIHPAYPSGR